MRRPSTPSLGHVPGGGQQRAVDGEDEVGGFPYYVQKDNERRMRKICKQYAKLYEKLDTHKESERRFHLNEEDAAEEGEEYTIRYHENYKHFEKLQDLVKNRYYDNSKRFVLDYCRTKPCIIFEILIDGKYKRFRYF
jgi:hypothetical protein